MTSPPPPPPRPAPPVGVQSQSRGMDVATITVDWFSAPLLPLSGSHQKRENELYKNNKLKGEGNLVSTADDIPSSGCADVRMCGKNPPEAVMDPFIYFPIDLHTSSFLPPSLLLLLPSSSIHYIRWIVTHTHTHTSWYIYIYIYISVACVFCFWSAKRRGIPNGTFASGFPFRFHSGRMSLADSRWWPPPLPPLSLSPRSITITWNKRGDTHTHARARRVSIHGFELQSTLLLTKTVQSLRKSKQ